MSARSAKHYRVLFSETRGFKITLGARSERAAIAAAKKLWQTEGEKAFTCFMAIPTRGWRTRNRISRLAHPLGDSRACVACAAVRSSGGLAYMCRDRSLQYRFRRCVHLFRQKRKYFVEVAQGLLVTPLRRCRTQIKNETVRIPRAAVRPLFVRDGIGVHETQILAYVQSWRIGGADKSDYEFVALVSAPLPCLLVRQSSPTCPAIARIKPYGLPLDNGTIEAALPGDHDTLTRQYSWRLCL
jgi:hypothetical protein